MRKITLSIIVILSLVLFVGCVKKVPLVEEVVHCGNDVIEENLGENCEPPEYTEVVDGKEVYVCKTKYGNFYDVLCPKDTCRCLHPETGEDFLTIEPETPILTPIALCGNGILNPGEQCDVGIACPKGFACVACRCVAPVPGAAKCGDGAIQTGEDCEWDTTTVPPSLKIPCKSGFTCGLPGSPNECKCLTEVKAPEGEAMPLLGKGEAAPPEGGIGVGAPGTEAPLEEECRECRVCSLEQAKEIVSEISTMINDDEILMDILVKTAYVFPKLVTEQTKIMTQSTEYCELNTDLKAFLEKYKNFITSVIAYVDDSLTTETEEVGLSEAEIASLENFKAKLISLRIKIDSRLEEIEECDVRICETQQNGQWVKVDCDKCENIEQHEEIKIEIIEMDLTGVEGITVTP